MQGVRKTAMAETTHITITGARGFAGSYLLKELANDSNVTVTALTRNASSAVSSEQSSRLTWQVTDYSEESLMDIMAGTDVIIHLAGTKGFKTDPSDFDGDYAMMQNLLNAAAKCGVKRFLYASSRMVYGDARPLPWKENGDLDPVTAYGTNKLRCEKLGTEFAQEHGFDFCAVRIAQLVGRGEGTRTMINVFAELAEAHKELTVIGRSEAKRQYLYTKDLASILHKLALHDGPLPSAINAGMLEGCTNLEIAEFMNKAYMNPVPVNYRDDEPETISPSIMDVSVLGKITGLAPMSMEQALKDMANDN